MNTSQAKYALEWMPSLLKLCMEIQVHTEKLHVAKSRLKEKIGNILRELEESRSLDKQVCLAQEELRQRQSQADKAEVRYVTYREGIMSRMMDAARAGESIDREEAGRLVELEVDRNLTIEQLREARSRSEDLANQRKQTEADIQFAYSTCDEVANLHRICEAAAQHLGEMSQKLGDLAIEKAIIDNANPENALSLFSKVIESYSSWVTSISELKNKGGSIQDQTKQLERTVDIDTIDSITLFSEICIAIATHQDGKKLSIPCQEAFTGDLTEY